MYKTITILIIIIFLAIGNLKGQIKLSPGLHSVYNNPLNGFGAGLRIQGNLSTNWALCFQTQYMPGFNAVNEMNANLNLLYYPVSSQKTVSPYLFGGLMGNYWFNYTPSSNPKANQKNFLADAGAGLQFTLKGIIPFAEFHYNPIWNESNTMVGLRIQPTKSLRKYKKTMECPKIL